MQFLLGCSWLLIPPMVHLPRSASVHKQGVLVILYGQSLMVPVWFFKEALTENPPMLIHFVGKTPTLHVGKDELFVCPHSGSPIANPPPPKKEREEAQGPGTLWNLVSGLPCSKPLPGPIMPYRPRCVGGPGIWHHVAQKNICCC